MNAATIQAAALLASVLLIAVGCYMAWPPLGLIVPGTLILVGIVSTRIYRGQKND